MLIESLRFSNKTLKKVYFIAILLSIFYYLLSLSRHYLFQSNAYDLGLFDQWIWLLSQGFSAYSSMCGLHIFADHGAWILVFPALLYKILPRIDILLISQAIALNFTSIPLWMLSKYSGLSDRKAFLICILWFLQPVVFNVNLFDFHPEVLVMPLIAFSYLFLRKNQIIYWCISLVFILGARDGLILLILGFSIEQICRRKFNLASYAFAIAIIWSIFLNRFLYPSLNLNNEGVLAVGNHFGYLGSSLQELIINIINNPLILFRQINYEEGLFYIVILYLPFVFFLRKSSFPVLNATIPLLLVNLLAETFSFRTLIHHYSLPIALVINISCIDSIKSINFLITFRRIFIWLLICWSALAKPWFFIGPYLNRIDSLAPAYEAFSLISNEDRILTTSYFVPHLSQRLKIDFPRPENYKYNLNDFDTLLLNHSDPGWGSDAKIQEKFIYEAKENGWSCKSWNNNLEFCTSKFSKSK